MIDFLKKYKAFGIGLLIVVPIILILHQIKFILIPDNAPIEIFLVFTFWWFMISLPIHKLDYLKKKKRTIYKIGGLMLLFFGAMIVDSNMRIPDNPITFLLLLLFLLGSIYILTPVFFTKYLKLIVAIYVSAMLYFTYVRLFSGDIETYREINKGMAISFFFIPIPLFIILWLFEQWKWLKTLQADKSKAELALLKTQINPHFFFNTLNNLYALTVKHSDQAPAVILKLSEMMRYTIYEGKKELVPLKDEIEYLNNYIDLHKIRYHKSVDIQFNTSVDESLQIAPLMYIILLENAFKHGVESLSDKAYIHINLQNDASGIQFTIENNFEANESNQEKGIGLDNIKQRLKLIYPKQHELHISEKESIFKVDLKIMTQ
ncbi:MAG: hypothetical protein ACI93S_001111 [Ancylomarina sp.]|jgi:hypothetical protein